MSSAWRPFVPDEVVRALTGAPGRDPRGDGHAHRRGRALRRHRRVHADERGPGQGRGYGAEELSRILNDYFGSMVERAVAYGGSVVRLTGDALTALFPYDRSTRAVVARRAVQCALDMQAAMAAFQAVDTEAGVFRLAMRAGLGDGPRPRHHRRRSGGPARVRGRRPDYRPGGRGRAARGDRPGRGRRRPAGGGPRDRRRRPWRRRVPGHAGRDAGRDGAGPPAPTWSTTPPPPAWLPSCIRRSPSASARAGEAWSTSIARSRWPSSGFPDLPEDDSGGGHSLQAYLSRRGPGDRPLRRAPQPGRHRRQGQPADAPVRHARRTRGRRGAGGPLLPGAAPAAGWAVPGRGHHRIRLLRRDWVGAAPLLHRGRRLREPRRAAARRRRSRDSC